MTFIEKLEAIKKEEDAKKKNGGSEYDQGEEMEEVYIYNIQFRNENPNEYPYNDSIKRFILEREKIGEIDCGIERTLETKIYLSQQRIREEKKQEFKDKMLADGWLVLDNETFDEANKSGKKIIVSAETESILTGKNRFEQTYKTFIDHEGTRYLMKPRQTRNGYWLNRFENAFCKFEEVLKNK
jgi:hemin uptake protein HemP